MEYRNKIVYKDICMPFSLVFLLLFFLSWYLYGIASLWRCALNSDNNLELSRENVGGWHRPQRRLTGYLRTNKGLNYRIYNQDSVIFFATVEAEFLDVIGIKVFRVFLFASHSHLY